MAVTRYMAASAAGRGPCRRSINQEIALSRYWREKAAEKSPADADTSGRALDIDRIHYTTAATNAQGGTT